MLLIDTHIHMVPGVDDGARDIDMAIQMLHVAKNEGINEMILTPHFNSPRYDNQNVIENFNKLRDYILTYRIDFKIHLGNEIYLSEEDIDAIVNRQVFTMAGSRYLLIELPVHQFYPFHEMMIHNLQENGYRIILAHVERYQIFENKPQMLQEFVKKGIYCQITTNYIMNKKTRKKAFKLIKNGLVHIVASDGHNIDKRPPVMKNAYDIIYKAFGQEWAQLLFIENPQLVIMDSILKNPPVEQIKKRYFF